MQVATQELVNHESIAATLIRELAITAIERDALGGTPKHERNQLRKSGLLKLIIPREYGGFGETWTRTLKLVREFAKVDSSIAHLFSYHHLGVVAPHLFGTPEQKERYYAQTARNDWFWCNAFNPLDRRVTLTAEGPKFRLNGIKNFCSGSQDSDLIPVSAAQLGNSKLAVVIVPTARQGVVVNGDWDNIGQRQTDSGSITFDNVWVEPDEILGPPGPFASPFGTLRSCLTQITFTNIYLGIAQGAFAAAKEYTQTETRAWLNSGVEKATQDPYILKHYGEMWTQLSAAEALADKAMDLVQDSWQLGEALTAEQRAECALAIATAKILVTRVGLEVTSRIFEVMGTRSTAAKYRFDRYWRNLRTFTLHDPVDYKVRDVGNWALNDELPIPNFYA